MADLVALKDLKSYLFQDKATDAADVPLQALLTAVSAMVRERTGMNFDPRSYTEFHDGTGKRAIQLHQPPVRTAQALPTVKEDGVVLTVAQGYSDSADVILRNETDPPLSLLYRRPGTATLVGGRLRTGDGLWSRGIQNVEVSYPGGYDTIPENIQLFVKYAVAYFWEHSDRKRIGVSRRTGAQGGTTEFFEDLPESIQMLIQPYLNRFILPS